MKFRYWLLVIFLCIVGILFCTKTTVSDKNEVVFWTLQLGTFSDYMNPIIEEFESKNPSVKIKWIDVPYSEGEKRTLASILSNNPPDLVNLTPDFSSVLAQKQALYTFDCNSLKNYNSQIVNSLKYNGRCYAVPFYATSAITFYDKKLVSSAGINIIPKSYDELYSISEQIKRKTGKYSTMPMLTENDTMLKILNKYGINTPDKLLSDKSKDVFLQYKTLYVKELIPRESLTQTHREALEQYMSGQIVFIQSGANFLTMVKDNAPKVYDSTGVSYQLTGSSGKYDVSIMNLIIPQRAKNKEAALKFALFLTNRENQIEFAKLTPVLPVNNQALNDEYFNTYNESDLISKARYISAKQLTNLESPIHLGRNHKEILNLINTSVQEVLLGKSEVSSILSKTSKMWKALLSNE